MNTQLVNRRIDPRNKSVIVDLSPYELKLGLEPVEFTLVIPGFERRIAPVTKQELEAVRLAA